MANLLNCNITASSHQRLLTRSRVAGGRSGVGHILTSRRRFPTTSYKSVSGQLPYGRLQGSCPVVVNSSRCHCAKRHDANVNKIGPTKTGRSAIGGLLTSANDDPRAKPREQLQDAGEGDCSGCGCGFRLRTSAEMSVMTSPIGKGSMNVSTALKNGFLYSSLYFLTC